MTPKLGFLRVSLFASTLQKEYPKPLLLFTGEIRVVLSVVCLILICSAGRRKIVKGQGDTCMYRVDQA